MLCRKRLVKGHIDRLKPYACSSLLHNNGPCHIGMVVTNIGKCAGFGKGETKGATSGQVPTVKCPVVTGDRMGNRSPILPDYGAAHRDREGSRAEVSTADDDHLRRWL
jgi:hypothetical protein